MHFMYPTKVVQIRRGHIFIFVFEKKMAITFGEGCITEVEYKTL